MGAGDASRRHDFLLAELAEERVAALTRISRMLESLIGQLRTSRDRLARLGGADRAAEIAHYGQVRAKATRYRWYLDVQRDALGLRHHALVDEHYAVPGPIDV
jgi:hypothetical protein